MTLDTSNQTLDQAAARAQRAARRAGRDEGQTTAENNSAETPAAATARDDEERADTEHVTQPELNTTARNSGASEATRTPTRKKRGRTVPDSSDSEQEVKRDKTQGQKRGHSTTPASDVDQQPRKGLRYDFRNLIPHTETESDESMEKLKTLEEHTTKFEAIANLHPNKLIIKCNQKPTKGEDNSVYFDIRSAQNLTLEPETTTAVQTGLRLELPPGYNLLLFSRPKLAKEGYTVASGDHRGEKILITNRTRKVKQLHPGEKIAHGILVQAPEIEFRNDISETQKADQKLGSTTEI